MNIHKVTVLVFLGCAVFVFGNGQAPPDDDDFALEGSGAASTTAASATVPFSGRSGAASWPWEDGSGSGHHPDDEDDYYDYDDEEVYDIYDDYLEEDGAEEGGSSSSSGTWGGGTHDDSKSSATETERTGVVGVVHAIPPATEKEPTVINEDKPSLGAERQPDTKPVLPPDEDEYGNELDESDISIAPDVRLQEVERELEDELEQELEQELERDREQDRSGDVDGLGAKPVDRNTSFFAQPGILAAVVGGAVVGLLCAILLVMLIVYRMRKKDEGSYPVDEPRRSLTGGNTYSKNKEFYA